jgi:hypothetical protein
LHVGAARRCDVATREAACAYGPDTDELSSEQVLRGVLLVFLLTLSSLQGAAAAPGRSDDVANLSITGSASAQQVVVGSHVTATFTVTNAGPNSATRSAVHVSAGPSVLVGASLSGSTCTVTPASADCPYPDPLGVGASYQVTVEAAPTTNGTLRLHASVRAREDDPSTTDNGVTVTVAVVVPDTEAPSSVAISRLPPFETPISFPVRWSGTDAISGIASYVVRYRAASWHGAFGPFKSWKQTADRQATFTALPGYTYCFSVDATDKAQNVSPWSSETCTADISSAKSFHRSPGWGLLNSKQSVRGVVLSSEKPGATLTLGQVAARRLLLYVSTCTTCGKVEILWRGRHLKTISLKAVKPVYGKTVVLLAARNLETGTLTLKVVTGKVQIEGIGISRV